PGKSLYDVGSYEVCNEYIFCTLSVLLNGDSGWIKADRIESNRMGRNIVFAASDLKAIKRRKQNHERAGKTL
ncbi:hypothetical protein ACFLZM_08190, partial [Thermodesulfobacteriota bacterium]